MSSWPLLLTELETWLKDGRTVLLWWRDDDAFEPCSALSRLVDISERNDVPVAVSVIPSKCRPGLEAALARPLVTVLQHGCEHRNRAGPGQKKCEMLAEPAVEECLARGKARLLEVLGSGFVPVLVPPWNRIADGLVPRLGGLGFSGLSLFSTAKPGVPLDLPLFNTHIDIIDWKGSRGCLGESALLEDLLEALRHRRTAGKGRFDPIGLLTHHLDHDTACWAFVETLLSMTRNHPAVRWLKIEDMLSSNV